MVYELKAVARIVKCAIGRHEFDHPVIDRYGVALRCMHCGKERQCIMLPFFRDGWDKMNERNRV